MCSGEVTREQGSKVRNSILSGEARTKIEKKIREEVDYMVIYAQIFEALRRIDPKNDPALRFWFNRRSQPMPKRRKKKSILPTTKAWKWPRNSLRTSYWQRT